MDNKVQLCIQLAFTPVIFICSSVNYKDVDKQVNKCCVQVKSLESQALLFRRGLGDEGKG